MNENCEKLRHIEAYLRDRIIGQDHVIPDFAAVLRRGELGLPDPRRPKGKFLFMGPTGVGKTELTLLGCEYLFGDFSNHCIRLDMSEYQTPSSLSLLLGTGGGDEGNLGRGFDRSQGKGFILFDEIEKSYQGATDLFLQILDAARITLASGRTLDLSQYYVVATSNIGSDLFRHARKSTPETLARIVRARAEGELRPEVVGRFDKMIVFRSLQYDSQVIIAENMLRSEIERLSKKGHHLEWTREVLSFLIGKGMRPELGARPMRNAVSEFVQNAVVDRLLEGKNTSPARLTVAGEKLQLVDP